MQAQFRAGAGQVRLQVICFMDRPMVRGRLSRASFVRARTASLPELELRHDIASFVGYADCLSLSLGPAGCFSSQTCKYCAAVARKGQRVDFEVAAFARCASVAQLRLCVNAWRAIARAGQWFLPAACSPVFFICSLHTITRRLVFRAAGVGAH